MKNESYRYGEKPKDEWTGRIVSILDEARANTVCSINTQMVVAYGLIGREIVLEEQKGDTRAEYGKQLIRSLSLRLTDRFGKGFSLASVKLFRQFYHPRRTPQRTPARTQLRRRRGRCLWM